MADSNLANYFSVDPSSTIWGAGQNALAAALPAFQTPGQGYSQNFASAMGASLLSALLGYQAQRSAAQQSLEAAGLGQQLLGMQTPEERLGFIQNVGDSTVQERLLGLNTKLAEQELTNKLAREQKIADLTTGAEFNLSPLGQQLQEQQLRNEVLLRGIQAGREPGLAFADLFKPQVIAGEIPQIPGLTPQESKDLYIKDLEKKAAQEGTEGVKQQKSAIATVRDLEKTFRNLNMSAAEFKARSVIPGDPAELAFSKLKGSLAALARASGQTSQLSDVDLQQQMDSIIGPSVPIFGMISGTSSIAERLKDKLKSAQQSANVPSAPTGNSMEMAAQDFLTNLKNKYGTEWASKATQAERQTASALREAAGK
jgi:hypothetical protein